jgi:aspartate/methionine/tyrosine aminotransferase
MMRQDEAVQGIRAMKYAARMRDIAPFHVMEVQERALRLESQGRHVVHMEIGQPDFGAPAQVIEAAIEALRSRRLGYTSSLGLRELREAISRFYAEHHGVAVPVERIAVTTGASGAFLLALGALLGPGDEVLVPDPCYPCIRHLARIFEARPMTIPVDHTTGYQPTAAQVRSAWRERTRGLLLASPSNPAGTTIAEPLLAELVDAVRSQGGFTVVDEIYQGLTYGPPPRTALGLDEDIVVTNSFSKYFSMTGWRLGWLVAPAELLRQIEKLAQNLYVSPPAPAQYAALAAFRPETLGLLEERRLEFQRRRDFLVPALRAIGFSVPVMPQGAFYVYAGCERFSRDSESFAMELLEEAGVALTPGIDFGSHRAERHLRFAYTCSMPELEEGVERLARRLARRA